MSGRLRMFGYAVESKSEGLGVWMAKGSCE